MGRIVVGILRVIIGLDNRQPVVECLLITVEHVRHIEVVEQVHPQVLERSLPRQLLQPEDVELPGEGGLHQFPQSRRYLDISENFNGNRNVSEKRQKIK